MFGLQRSLRLALLMGCLTNFGLSKAPQKSIDPEIENEEISELMLDEDESDQDTDTQDIADKIIRTIIVTGNSQVSTAAILNKIPYRVGQRFDPLKTREAIRNLYYDFKRFRTITIWADIVDADTIDLQIDIQEKIPLKEVIFEGLYGVTEKEINEKVTSLETPAVDPEELKIFANGIKKLYLERGYYTVAINPELIVDENGKGTIIFRIIEGPKAMVKRISFMGNRNVSSKTLRSIMYTREEWLLSFLINPAPIYLIVWKAISM